MPNLVRLGCAIVAALLLNIAVAVWQPAHAQSTTIVISEFRTRGPLGANDEFVELTNISAASVDISGYTMRGSNNAGTNSIRATVPAATTLPPGGHYLFVNDQATGTNEYSLTAYAAGDTPYVTGVTDDGGFAIFDAAATPAIVDQVGMSAGSAYKEGTTLTPMVADAVSDYSYVRKLNTGVPQDTNNNANDFVLVATDGTDGTITTILGAPGPENRTSPVQRNATVKASLIDPQSASTATPNRVRDTSAYTDFLTPSSPTGTTQGVPNGSYGGGTLSIQRRFTNQTGAPITRLRFRVVDITTLNSPGAGASQADVRWLTSNGTLRGPATVPAGVTLLGITIEQPPSQPSGAALNSSGMITLPGGSLAPGTSVDVQFLLGVVQGGSFRYIVNVEAVTAPPGLAAPAITKATGLKGASLTKQ